MGADRSGRGLPSGRGGQGGRTNGRAWASERKGADRMGGWANGRADGWRRAEKRIDGQAIE